MREGGRMDWQLAIGRSWHEMAEVTRNGKLPIGSRNKLERMRKQENKKLNENQLDWNERQEKARKLREQAGEESETRENQRASAEISRA